MCMPQSERASIIKQLLKWLDSKEKGATTEAILHYTKWEISEGGATDSTIKKYIQDLDRACLIEYKHPYWKITTSGKKWLKKHII